MTQPLGDGWSAAPASPHFPATLDQTPPRERLTEVFGLAPTLFGLGLLVHGISVLAVSPPVLRDDLGDLLLPGLCMLAGLACLAYEVYRRTRRTRLLPRGDGFGVYRGAAFSEEIHRSQVIEYKLEHLNTFKMVVGPLVIGGLLLFLALKPGQNNLRLFLGGMGSVLLGLAVSTLVTRLACRHFFIPRGAKTETVMLFQREARRLRGEPERP